MTNLEVDDENVLWLYYQTECYWSIENAQAREKMYTGRAAGPGVFWRHWMHGAGMVMLACYALWRLERRLRLAKAGEAFGTIKRRKSHRRFFGAVRSHLAAFFVPEDTPRKRL